MKATDYAILQPQHSLIYGEPKTKKSRLVMQLAEAGFKLKYFCIDGGIPIKGQTKETLDNVEVFILRDTSTFQVGIKTIRRVIKGDELFLCDFHGNIDCKNCKLADQPFSRVCLNEMQLDEIFVLDHLTALSNSALNTVWDGNKYAESSIPADDTTSFNIWRQQGWLTADVLKRAENAPFNTAFICQEALAKMEDGATKIIPQAGTDNFSRTIPGYFHHIIHCDRQNGEFKFTSIKNNQAIVGSRDNIAIEDMKVPSLVPFYPKLGVERPVVVTVPDGNVIRPNILKKVDPVKEEIKEVSKQLDQVDKLAAMKAKLASAKK